MIERKYYHVWRKGTSVENSLLIKVEGDSIQYLTAKLSVDAIIDIVKVKLTDNGLTVNEDYNINEISEKRAYKKMQSYRRDSI